MEAEVVAGPVDQALLEWKLTTEIYSGLKLLSRLSLYDGELFCRVSVS